jgi:hypothetical protein
MVADSADRPVEVQNAARDAVNPNTQIRFGTHWQSCLVPAATLLYA